MNKQLHFTQQASEFLTEQSAAVQKAFFEKLKKLSDDGLLREPDAKKIALIFSRFASRSHGCNIGYSTAMSIRMESGCYLDS